MTAVLLAIAIAVAPGPSKQRFCHLEAQAVDALLLVRLSGVPEVQALAQASEFKRKDADIWQQLVRLVYDISEPYYRDAEKREQFLAVFYQACLDN